MPLIRVSKRSGGTRMRSRGGKMRRSMISYGGMSTAGRQYLKSVLNPSYGGAKIPDSFGAKTCTIQLQRERKIDLQSGATVLGGLMHVSIAPLSWTYNATGSGSWTVDSLIDGAVSYQTYVTGGVTYNGSKLPTLFRSGRVVSAGLKVQYVGTTQNDQGTVTVFGVDRTHLASQLAVTNGTIGNPDLTSYAYEIDPIGPVLDPVTGGSLLRNLPINAFGPIRQGCTARYFPIDDTDLDFHPFPPVISGLTSENFNGCRAGAVAGLGFLCEGLGAGGSVIVQYTVNLECTVRDDSFHLVSSESSPVDSRALSRCASVYLKKPQVAVGSLRGDTESINVYSR